MGSYRSTKKIILWHLVSLMGGCTISLITGMAFCASFISSSEEAMIPPMLDNLFLAERLLSFTKVIKDSVFPWFIM